MSKEERRKLGDMLSCSPTSRAASRTVIERTSTISKASNIRVNPDPGRAQGTCTCLTPSLSHLQRGTLAVK